MDTKLGIVDSEKQIFRSTSLLTFFIIVISSFLLLLLSSFVLCSEGRRNILSNTILIPNSIKFMNEIEYRCDERKPPSRQYFVTHVIGDTL